MQPPRCHSATISGGKHIRCGALSRFVATEVSRFVLYFLFFFEEFRHHPELHIGIRLVHAFCILLARISTGIFFMGRFVLFGTFSLLLHRIPIQRGLYHRLRERDVVGGGVKRRTGMLAKSSILETSRGAVRRAIVVVVVMASVATRTMMNSVSKAR